MELTLTYQSGDQVIVICDGQPSHLFDLRALVPSKVKGMTQPLGDLEGFGKAVYQALFPSLTAALHALHTHPERILLVAPDDDRNNPGILGHFRLQMD